MKAAIAQIYEAKCRVDAVREGILAGLKSVDYTSEIFIAVAAFDGKSRAAERVPMAELTPPYGIVPSAE